MNMNDAAKKAGDKADDAAHSASADKAKGHAKEIIGTVKAKVGNLVGDRELEARGHAQNAEGKTDVLKGEIKEKIEDAKTEIKEKLDDAKNMVKAGVGVAKDKIDELRGK